MVGQWLPILLWRALLFSVLVLLPAGRAQSIQIDALLGFGSSPESAFYRAGCWTPLTIYLSGEGIRGVGQVQVVVRDWQTVTRYVRRVSLQEGPINETVRFSILMRARPAYYLPPGTPSAPDIRVTLLVNGQKKAEETLVLPEEVPPTAFNVLALTGNPDGLFFLQRKNPGLLHRGYVAEQADARVAGPLAAGTVLYTHATDLRALPEFAQAYEMMDAVVLGDLPLQRLTPAQLRALEDYVVDGGLLIVTGNDNMARLQHSFLARILPIIPTGFGPLDPSVLVARYRGPLPRNLGAVRGRLKPGGQALLGQAAQTGTLPLVSARDHGNGTVVFTSFDTTALELRGWSGVYSFWRDLLSAGRNTVSPRRVLQQAARMHGFAFADAVALADALAGERASRIPSLWTLSAFIGLYILLLVPVSYLLLKRWDRRELAWITAPLLILAFTGVAYAIGHTLKGSALTANRLTILEGATDTEQLAGYAQVTLYSPARATHDVVLRNARFPEAPFLPHEIYLSSDLTSTPELTLDQDIPITLRQVRVRQWDTRSFEMPFVFPLEGTVAVQTESARNGYRATIVNRTPYLLRDCALLNGDRVITIGDLAPGARRTLDNDGRKMRWQTEGSWNFLSLPSPGTPGDAAHVRDAPAWRPIQSALIRTLATTGKSWRNVYPAGYAYAASGSAPNVFIGWFTDPVVEVQVDGRTVEGDPINLLVVHLPVPARAPMKLQAIRNPFLRPPARQLEDAILPEVGSR
ncbi:MAG: hypothetical protein RMJ43_09835 [Chloroherpetonaceae bacterium]|nr:hypothetical protein [Chthonomonadaceae bacterium]MDW8208126.1 hypothetical protein [Chloroherpetonaceae bacterium]